MTSPRIAVAPRPDPEVVEAVRAGGGGVVAEREADALVWVDPSDPHSLRSVLEDSPARWVQLPSAGIEPFVAAGVLDDQRTWTCAKGIFGVACAEHALGLMIVGGRMIHRHARATSWRKETPASGERRLRGSTVVIVGTRGIGRPLAEMLRPLGAAVVGVNRSGNALEGAVRTVPVARLPEELPRADFVVLAAALTSATRGLFDGAMLARMKRGAWLVNVARGGLVDTDALVDCLRRRAIGGAALDVTDPEPLPDGHALWAMDDVVITPHVANTWEMGLPELCGRIKRNVRSFAEGRPLEGLVDPALEY